MLTQKGNKMPGAPNFKNSKLKLNASINSMDKISVSFWLNIDNKLLADQIEAYYAVSDKKPSIQLQRKDVDTYTNVASANLFLPDEKLAAHQAANKEKVLDKETANEVNDVFPGS